jgi:peptide/nickel transport system permease protein
MPAASAPGRGAEGPAPEGLRPAPISRPSCPDAWTGLGLVLVVAGILAACLPGALAPLDPAAQVTAHRLRPPLWRDAGGHFHPLGTDQLGRDLWSRVVHGARVSLLVAGVAVAIAGTLGLAFGLGAGYFGGWVDAAVMRAGDALLAMPFILLAIALVAALGPGLGTLIGVLGITGWVATARVVRAQTLSLEGRDFVAAARALGAGHGRILMRHLLPNALGPAAVMGALEVGRVILLESALSFLGLGVPPPTPTWGGMLADGRVYLSSAWWLATFPGLAILLTVLGINLVGDWLRERLDPTLAL